MKSIDEGVIDFSQAPQSIVERGLENIGREIKQRLRDEIAGCCDAVMSASAPIGF